MQRRITSFFAPPRAADGAVPAHAQKLELSPPEETPQERQDPDGSTDPTSPGNSSAPVPPMSPRAPCCPPSPQQPGDRDGDSDRDRDSAPPASKRCRQSPSNQDKEPPRPHKAPSSNSCIPVEPSQYDPSRSGYHPVQDACWGHGHSVPYLAVARTFERIEEASSRLKIIEILTNFLRSVVALSPSELLPCLLLCLNRPGAASEGLELGIGETLLTRALAQATGRQLAQIRSEAQDKGDLGLVAESSRCTQRTVVPPAPLSASGVLGKLREMAAMSGNASASKKIDIIKGLFVACRHSEARYLVRSLSGKLRIGLAEQSVLTALAHAVALTPPGQEWPLAVVDAGQSMAPDARRTWLEEQSRILKQTFCELPDYAAIVPVLLEHGLEQLPKHCGITPGVPLKPMLAQPARCVSELLKRFEEAAFTCEYKYDGERTQIHVLDSGAVFIYSRNQENTTAKYPDLVERIPKDVDAAAIKVQVCVYAFDLLYLNGEPLVREPLATRRRLLRQSFEEVEGEFLFATSMDTHSADEVSDFLDKAIKASCEGLMVKTLEVEATYEIAKRSHKWLKLKKDYLDGLGDTLDLVVIGAYLGKGKRAGIYGGFLLACYDEESEEYQSICKIGTGFTEENLEKHYNFLKEHVLTQPRPYYRWDNAVAPDRWLAAVQVWEVKCGDLSISPVYRAAVGLVDEDKGISLRFPRFLRVRGDKKPEEATSSTWLSSTRSSSRSRTSSRQRKGTRSFIDITLQGQGQCCPGTCPTSDIPMCSPVAWGPQDIAILHPFSPLTPHLFSPYSLLSPGHYCHLPTLVYPCLVSRVPMRPPVAWRLQDVITLHPLYFPTPYPVSLLPHPWSSPCVHSPINHLPIAPASLDLEWSCGHAMGL
ncbi:DNA ligase 1 isoform X2 [Lagopus muta]|uniref:DNA ligase 1 isoform X2 n=1 Tax=Lagopus muta TaxID=64668 RepID=UPI0020A15E85|nr:DNA ligase 1 isoform X2 [Lagopus muta]